MQRKRKKPEPEAPLSSLEFFGKLTWIDGRPLLDTIETYRRDIFTAALDTFGRDGLPKYNLVVCGRGKKNWKSSDLILGALFKLVIPESYHGSDDFIVGNDEGQASDDLSLAKKLVEANPNLKAELEVYQKEIRRRDGRGTLKILPAQNVVGQHGKTACFIGYDEIHGYRSWDLLEALAPDPTRRDALQWITSYDTIYNQPGVPLHDLKQIGFAGTDPRMLFSWYSGDKCTDPEFADLPPEERANPSMLSWSDPGYLEQQRARLPTHKYRRLHLNLPGSPNSAFFDQGSVLRAMVPGRRKLDPRPKVQYFAGVDMSGGGQDNSVLCIAHVERGRAVVDLIEKQAGNHRPFDPVAVVYQFVNRLREYGISKVYGDHYGGHTFRFRFDDCGIQYIDTKMSASDFYERLEVRVNAGECELPGDVAELTEELLTLVVKGAKVTHEAGNHDDFANACAIAVITTLEYEINRVHWYCA
jgi:hypothetical protein